MLPTDRDLVEEARRGRTWAQEALFKRYCRMAFGIASRLLGRRDEVADVVQDSFLSALGSLHRLKESDVFSTWLGQIVVYTVYRVRRRERLLTRLGLRTAEPIDPASLLSRSVPPDVAAEVAELYRRLERLPEKQRIAFIMRRVEGRELADIAMLMKISIPTVKRLLKRAAVITEDEPLAAREGTS